MAQLYRIQVKFGDGWRWGLHDYTYDQAVHRYNQLKAAGIKARIRPNFELFN